MRESGRTMRIRGAAIGLLAAAVSLGVGEVVAAILGVLGPVVSVGAVFIDLTPEWLKSFAIRAFGTADKAVLLGGIAVVLVVVSIALGIVGMSRPRVAFAGLAILGVLGAIAALSRPDASWVAALPPLLGALAGGVAFRFLRGKAFSESVASATVADDPAAAPTAVAEPAARVKLVATDRRGFLRAAMLVGGAAVFAGVAGRGLSSRSQARAARTALRLPLPAEPAAPIPMGAELGVRDVAPFITPNDEFYRIDTSLVTPSVSTEGWTLKIGGMVDVPMELTYEDLIARPMIERVITIACVSNEVGGDYIGTARWIGVPLEPLMAEAGVQEGADQMVSRSVDGFTIGTPTSLALDGRDAMLAVQMNGEPLPFEHGFPVRMIIPGLYGYNSAMKWITDIEMSTFDAFDAYWVRRGWATVAPVLTQSRIDTPKRYAERSAGPLTIAGVAWAQHRGISRVEVRIDEGDWLEATLGDAPTEDAWRQWKYEWDATPGKHTLQVRATDGDGVVQTEERTPPFPDGARGWHTIPVTIA